MGTQTGEVRAITDAEVAFYNENGWVRLDQLISRDLAAKLLAAAQQRMGTGGDASELRPGKDLVGHPSWHDHHDIADEDETFGAVAYGKEMGRNAQRLMQRDVGVRAYANMLAVKLGMQQGSKTNKFAKTDFHQDGPTLAFDRTGYLGFWIALDEVTPEMGSLRFHSGSQRVGSLGRWFDGKDIFDVYPDAQEQYPISPGLHLQPGDATVHDSATIHGASANTTDKPRWAFLIGYFPADTRFTAAQIPGDEHIHDAERYGLRVGEVFDHPVFRLVYP